MICNRCGKSLPDDSAFCQFCGGKIESRAEPVDEIHSASKEEVLAKFLAAGLVEGHKAYEANKVDQPQNEEDLQFGLVPEKPIYTAGIDEQEHYLQSLRTSNGELIKWSRRGSMSVNSVHGLIDVYDIYLQSGAKYKTIYINMYGVKNSTIAPKGFILMGATIEETVLRTPKQKRVKVSKIRKPVDKKRIVGLAFIPIAAVIVALLVVFVLIPEIKYNHAMNLLENGNYELAYSELEKLDGYADSKNMLLECRYIQAVKYRDAGDYELANKIFESLGNYRDSKFLIHNHDYKVSNMVAATCTTAGSNTYKCTGCEDSYIETVTLNHAYVLTSSEEASCQKEGYKTFKCSYCNDEYTEKIGKTSHKSVVSLTQESTCTGAGLKQYKCVTCGYEFTEEIAQKAHSYSLANCTKPKTCSICGKTEGTALGHTTSGVKCSRCGEIIFKTLTYSGIGSKILKNITVPSGKFMILGCATSVDERSGSFYVYLNYSNGNRAAYWIESLNSYMEKAEVFYGPINGGYIEVQADSNISWTITIEAISD